MRPLLHRVGRAAFLVAAVVAFGAAAAPAPSGAAPMHIARAAGNSASFLDPQGDSVDSGPDITGVSISNDDSGNIHLQVLVPNSTSQANGGGLGIYFDVNGDGTDDYVIFVEPGHGNATLNKFVSGGSQEVTDPNFRSSYNAGLTVDFSRSAIGAATATQIHFVAETLYNDTTYYYDRAPDSGFYTYTLGAAVTPVTPLNVPLTTIVSHPEHPQAGQRFVVTFKAMNNGKSVATAGVSCSATAGKKTVAGKGSYAGGSGTCSLAVPHGTGGKALVVTVTVSAPGATGDTFVTRDTIVGEPTLKIGQQIATPPAPQAGGDFYLSIGVLVLRQGAPKSRLQQGSVKCTATIDGQKLHVKRALVVTGAGVQCGWSVPAWARGKTLHALVVVRSFGLSTQKTYTLHVH